MKETLVGNIELLLVEACSIWFIDLVYDRKTHG